jgi:hypothetical protein
MSQGKMALASVTAAWKIPHLDAFIFHAVSAENNSLSGEIFFAKCGPNWTLTAVRNECMAQNTLEREDAFENA